jgi:hypothetical protein
VDAYIRKYIGQRATMMDVEHTTSVRKLIIGFHKLPVLQHNQSLNAPKET